MLKWGTTPVCYNTRIGIRFAIKKGPQRIRTAAYYLFWGALPILLVALSSVRRAPTPTDVDAEKARKKHTM